MGSLGRRRYAHGQVGRPQLPGHVVAVEIWGVRAQGFEHEPHPAEVVADGGCGLELADQVSDEAKQGVFHGCAPVELVGVAEVPVSPSLHAVVLLGSGPERLRCQPCRFPSSVG